MTTIAEWSDVELENVKLDELSLTGPYGKYIAKLMAAIKQGTDEEAEGLVHTNGTETLGGLKRFTTSPRVPAPTNTADNSTMAAQVGWTVQTFEPKVRFDDTPVMSITLAEDATASAASPYEIVFDEGYDAVLLDITTPAAAATKQGIYRSYWGDQQLGLSASDILAAAGKRVRILAWNMMGLAMSGATTGASSGATAMTQRLAPSFVPDGAKLSKITISIADDADLPAGTTIDVYAAVGPVFAAPAESGT